MVAAPHKALPTRGFSVKRRIGAPTLALAAALSIGVWLSGEAVLGGMSHPASVQMHAAARIMQAATQVIRAEKRERGMLQPQSVDPNQTGLIGPEFTVTTTSLGVLAAKRTATNPDFAAALTRQIADLDLDDDAVVVALFSGSMVGANLATLAAVEALGLETVAISSLGASMFGATDPEFTWLDMEELLADRDIIGTRSGIALVGGNRGTGHGLEPEGVDALRASIERAGLEPLEGENLRDLLAKLTTAIEQQAGGGAALFVNAGGSVAAFGNCQNADVLPAGVIDYAPPCEGDVPGLIYTMAAKGVPVIHLLNMRGLAAQWGLPYDPIPFELVGNNRFVYGAAQ